MVIEPKKTVVTGVLLLNKPAGITSQAALNHAKRLFMANNADSKKAGHTGTLDPMATGLLPICFGEATKFSSYGLDADKGYEAMIELGTKTDTGDKEGEIIDQKTVPTFTQDVLDDIAGSMMGEQLQIPPMHSALKKDGKKLYEYARLGIDVDRLARPITVHKIQLTKIGTQQVRLALTCSKGTYVRVLGEQIAECLGTIGHLSVLHRTTTGGFDVAETITLDALAGLSFKRRFDCLLPIDAMVMHLPIITLSLDEYARIRLGQRLNIKDRLPFTTNGAVVMNDDMGTAVRLYANHTFLGLGQVWASGRLQPKKIVTAQLDF